ncbi:MAG TPA: hypothetical protein VIG25_20385 [Pyrinomonadaceae bacterium]
MDRIVRNSARQENIEIREEPDRAFVFDLNGDSKPEYFIPLSCGAVGNCDWGVFALNPLRFLGVVNGQYIYVYSRRGGWPAVITYGHLSAIEGSLETYTFSKGRYARVGDGYAIGPEDRTLIQNKPGRKLPKFLERARAACADVGS